MARPTVHFMLQQVLAESEAKLEKSASERGAAPSGERDKEKVAGAEVVEDAEKIANACDFLADHLHEVIDDREPQEKLAELVALQEALFKGAEDPPTDPPLDDGVNPGGPGSAMQAEETNTPGGSPLEGGDSGEATEPHQTPKTTTPTEKANPADAANAMPTNKDMMMGEQPEDVLKQAQLGQITADEASDKIAELWLKQAGVALIKRPGLIGRAASKAKAWAKEPVETYKKHRSTGKGSIGAGTTGLGERAIPATRREAALEAMKAHKGQTAAAAGTLATLGAGGAYKAAAISPEMAANAQKVQAAQDASKPGAEVPAGLSKKAYDSVRERMANAMLGQFKTAEDALNPAQISAGTKPILQSVAEANPAQMQGSEAGDQTPRETAPTSYQGAGRDLISSNDAAIGYTKGQAKSPQKKPLSELLTEPAMSSAHDKVLQKSLDSTSEAGVKISSLREMLKKAAATSPEAKAVIDATVKQAMGEVPPPGAGAGGAPPPPDAGGGAVPPPGENAGGGGEAEALAGATEPEVSDEAIAAAAEGVTTDELAKAQVMLASQAAQAGAQEGPPAEPPPAPEQGAEQPAPQQPPAPEQAQA